MFQGDQPQDEVQQISITVDQAKASIKRGEAIQRLQTHADFKEIVINGYFHQEAVRLTHLLSDPSQQAPEAQTKITSDLRSVGAFHSYLDTALRHAQMAYEAVEQGERELHEAEVERLEGHDDDDQYDEEV